MTELQEWNFMTYEEWHDYSDEVGEIEPNNMIPLKAAMDKMIRQLGMQACDSTMRRCLLKNYSDGLNIEKRGRYYYCSKDRLDFIDFTRYHAIVKFT